MMPELSDQELFMRGVRREALDKLRTEDQETIEDLARQLAMQIAGLDYDGALEVLSQIGKEYVDE